MKRGTGLRLQSIKTQRGEQAQPSLDFALVTPNPSSRALDMPFCTAGQLAGIREVEKQKDCIAVAVPSSAFILCHTTSFSSSPTSFTLIT